MKPVRVNQGKAFAELLPNDRTFRLDVEIDFPTPVIGRQRKSCDLSAAVFRREISRARTFGFMRDVEKLWSAGFALGASLENTVAIGEDGIINPEGLRYADEFVRHKLLDAIGDLSLAGMPLLGTYRSYCGGHRLNFAVLEALFSSRSNYAIVEVGTRREPGYADIGRVAMAAFAPEVHRSLPRFLSQHVPRGTRMSHEGSQPGGLSGPPSAWASCDTDPSGHETLWQWAWLRRGR
jgi:UDP-3-O-[3-hydroxymyristoyl] N-acetylglucosamine deacetylase